MSTGPGPTISYRLIMVYVFSMHQSPVHKYCTGNDLLPALQAVSGKGVDAEPDDQTD